MRNTQVDGLSIKLLRSCTFKNTVSASCACSLLRLFVFLKLKESERTMDTLNTKR